MSKIEEDPRGHGGAGAGVGIGIGASTPEHKETVILRSKVVVVGDATVGKTALTAMFFSGGNAYPKNYVMTIGVDFCMKVVNIPDTGDVNTQVELYLFDSAGQSIFNQRDLGTKHWKNVSQVMVVYDVSKRESFTSCAKWLKAVRDLRPNRPIQGVLVANKVDLKESGRAVVDSAEGMAFAKEMDLAFFETSALSGTDVDAPFNYLADQFSRKYDETMASLDSMGL